MSYQIVTANRLLDGHVVYLTAASAWSEDVKNSVCVDSESAGVDILEQAQAFVDRQEIIDPYLVDVEIGDEGVAPIVFRERIRAMGPTAAYATSGYDGASHDGASKVSAHQKRAA